MTRFWRCNPFKRSFAILLTLVAAAALFLYSSVIQLKESDEIDYQERLKSNALLRGKRPLKKEEAKQVRTDVQKDIWIVKEKKESHIQLFSEWSELTFYEKDHKFQAGELFGSLTGSIDSQDKERYELQAKRGSYLFPANSLTAEMVKVSMNSAFFLEADKANMLEGREMLELTGKVRLMSLLWKDKQTYALAEKACYHPKTETFILSGSPTSKVLCWQNGATLAAPEIHIQQDTKTMEGIGDVRCAFDREEQMAFMEIFAKYL